MKLKVEKKKKEKEIHTKTYHNHAAKNYFPPPKILTTREKCHLTYRGSTIQIRLISHQNHGNTMKWNNNFQVLEKNVNLYQMKTLSISSEIHYQMKILSFRNEGKIKIFLDEGKLR